MDKRYDEIMEHVEVTPEMRQRILKHIEQADLTRDTSPKVIRFPHIKQLATLAACLAIVLVGALTLPNLIQGPDSPDDPFILDAGDGIVQVTSIKELSETVGFEVTELSNLPFQPVEVIYTAYWQELAEVTYSGEGQTATWRMGIGTEDVSGDYNIYEKTAALTVDGIAVTLKGNNTTYTLATWTDGEFSYALALTEGISEMEWQSILAEVT